MENLALKIINEVIGDAEPEQPDSESFMVDNDEKAEWALSKIREEQAEATRIKDTCQRMIKHYEGEMRKAEQDLNNNTEYFKSQLERYFGTVKTKKSPKGTQETYKLPSGTLKRKYPNPKYDVDDKKLVEWLKERKMEDYIEVKEKAKWGEFKKAVKQAGSKVVDENGEVVEGVEVIDRSPTFVVEV